MDGSLPAGIGHNAPPEATPFEAFDTHIADLLGEARNFLDGEGVQTQGQADAVSQLLDQLRTAAKDADKARASEKKPHDDAAKAVQARWKPLLDRCDTATKVCKDALAPFLQRLEAERREAERKAREEADAARRAAEEAARAARADDLAAREEAGRLERASRAADAEASRAAKAKGQAAGSARATTLRSVWRAEIADLKEACRHFWSTNPEAFRPLIQQLAADDVRAGKRQVPGIAITEEKVVV